MRMRKHFATGAALTAAAAMILTACGGGSSTTTSTDGGSKASDGPKGTITAGVAYETTDYGPITTSALGMGANWQVLEGLYRLDRTNYSVSPALAAVLGDHNTSHIQALVAVFLDETQNVCIVGDAKVMANLVFLNVCRVDGNDDFSLVG